MNRSVRSRHFAILPVLLILSTAFSAAGCQSPRVTTAYRPSEIRLSAGGDGERKSIFIVSNGWHAGLILPAAEISKSTWPEAEKWRSYDNLEIGWGDESFYRAKRITPWLVVDALMIPSAGVLHFVASNGSITELYQGSELVELSVSADEFDRLCEYVSRTYSRDKDGEVKYLGPGLYGDSEFYQSDEMYYFPKTCNVWTARALLSAGVPVEPAVSTTAGGLVRQVRRLGTSRSKLAGMYNPFAAPKE